MSKSIRARAILGAGCLWLALAAGCASGAEEPPAAPPRATTSSSPNTSAGTAMPTGQGTLSDGLMYLLKR
jgi:hypothetical protein